MITIRRTTRRAAPVVVVAVAVLTLAAPSADAVRYMDPVVGTPASAQAAVAASRTNRIAALAAERRASADLQEKRALHNEIRLVENAVGGD